MQDMDVYAGERIEIPPALREQLLKAPIAAGIVAEYNPFHKGHQWMIQMLRQGGVHTVVCVMSGNFVQRAEPALLPVHVRARAAMAAGADLVLRLPVSWATASAEGFAQGAVGLLAALGCVELLAFGAETADADALGQVAEVLLLDDFSSLIRLELAKGQSFAAARAAAANLLLPGAADILRHPNNILGVEYMKALKGRTRQALTALLPRGTLAFPLPVPLALSRVGALHDGEPADGFASASWIRARVLERGMAAAAPWVPADCLPLYQKAAEAGEMTDPAKWDALLLARLRGRDALDFALHPGAGDGLEQRMASAAKQATTAGELYALAKSKRFAHSRVRRLALSTALDLPGDVPVVPPFGHILASNEKGLALLRRAKETTLIPTSTSMAKLEKAGPAAAAAAKTEAHADDLYALCQRTPAPGGGTYTRAAAFSTHKNT